MRNRFAMVLCLALCATASFLVPAATQAAWAGEIPAALEKADQKARRKAADTLHKLAKVCIRKRAFTDARRELRRALGILPGHEKATAELAKIEGRKDAAKADWKETFATDQRTAHVACVDLLTEVAKGYDEADLSVPFDALVDDLLLRFPDVDVRKKLGLIYFDAYVRWLREKDLRRYRNGQELVDGEWITATEVKALDEKHSSWDDPWRLSDGHHELRTNMKLRVGRSLLSHVTAYRKFFLTYFEGEWDLREPEGLLPVILTDTQEDFRGRLAANGSPNASPKFAAVYLHTTEPLGPCLVTFEPAFVNGGTARVGLENILGTLKHELGHQIAFEYSRSQADPMGNDRFHFWAVEGLADFLPNYELTADGWKLGHPAYLKLGPDYTKTGAFSWCQDKKTFLPKLADFVAYTHGEFMGENSVEHYRQAATLTYFLLEGADRRYRQGAIDLIAAVHRERTSDSLFEACLPDVDMDRLHTEFIEFVSGLKIDR